MIEDKQIWIFKEARAGSTWFCEALSKKINRNGHHYESVNYRKIKGYDDAIRLFKQEAHDLRDLNVFYATHYLPLMEYVNLLNKNTILIRLTRRDRTEHCLCILAFNMFGRTNNTHVFVNPINMLGNKEDSTSFYDEPKYVTKQQVKKIMQGFKEKDYFWNTYSKNYVRSLVVYEDLEKGVNIEPLEINMKFSDDTSYTKKNPDYKKEAFVNYDQIVEWCNEYEKKFELDKH